jgi:hypothetical protein
MPVTVKKHAAPCKLCGEVVRGDCCLTIGICAYCFYNTNNWDSNGRLVTREEAVLRPDGKTRRRSKIRPRVGLPPGVRAVLPHLLNTTLVALVRSGDVSAIDLNLLSDLLSKFAFRVLRVDLEGVTCAEDVAIRLSGAMGRDVNNLDVAMQMLSGLQQRQKLAVIVESFHHAARLPILKAKRIEGEMRSYTQQHYNAAWLFLGTREMLPAFTTYERPFYHSGLLLMEEDICRAHR